MTKDILLRITILALLLSTSVSSAAAKDDTLAEVVTFEEIQEFLSSLTPDDAVWLRPSYDEAKSEEAALAAQCGNDPDDLIALMDAGEHCEIGWLTIRNKLALVEVSLMKIEADAREAQVDALEAQVVNGGSNIPKSGAVKIPSW